MWSPGQYIDKKQFQDIMFNMNSELLQVNENLPRKPLIQKIKEEIVDTAHMLSAVAGFHGPTPEEMLDKFYEGEATINDVLTAFKRDSYRRIS